MHSNYSKLLGGGIESMAITEAFGGEIPFIVITFLCDFTWGLCQKCQYCFILQSFAQGRPSCLTLYVVKMELCKCGCDICIYWWNNMCKLWFLCCSCAVTSQLPGDDGYSGGKVIFIDTENTLYPQDYFKRHIYKLEHATMCVKFSCADR